MSYLVNPYRFTVPFTPPTLVNGASYDIVDLTATKNAQNITGWAYGDTTYEAGAGAIKYYYNDGLLYTSTLGALTGLYPKTTNYPVDTAMTLTATVNSITWTVNDLDSGNDHFGFATDISAANWGQDTAGFYIDNFTFIAIRENGTNVTSHSIAVSNGDEFKIVI